MERKEREGMGGKGEGRREGRKRMKGKGRKIETPLHHFLRTPPGVIYQMTCMPSMLTTA